MNQWIWNLRLDLGQHLSPFPLCLTEFAPAAELSSVQAIEPIQEQLEVIPFVQPPYRKGDPVGECDREVNAPSHREKEAKSRRVGAAGAPAFRLFCQRTSPTGLTHV
ncbi:hypothetical protein KSF_004940 [Reticulibacter mediterranei]|uniref:Uncharacterized protein n=1 Tax=Reticulibacter mediterranei TaxID=2778369 RepID=A0A8J3I9L1_9CHLR|nr:hypothetical protein [Reticulibacter mediterranei]GHO90446.1 hypothetical protein KSF_004940 [Reticulibacter mediterranei]